jgi:hypothetical protein
MSFKHLRGPDPQQAEIIARTEKFVDSSVGRRYMMRPLIELSGCARTTGAAMTVSGKQQHLRRVSDPGSDATPKERSILWNKRSC